MCEQAPGSTADAHRRRGRGGVLEHALAHRFAAAWSYAIPSGLAQVICLFSDAPLHASPSHPVSRAAIDVLRRLVRRKDPYMVAEPGQ